MMRREDRRFVTGSGAFVADIRLPGMLHAAFVRSPYAHAKIKRIDTSTALSMSGVVAAFECTDLPHRPLSDPMVMSGLHKTPQYCLARDRVRFAGEAVVLLVAQDRYRAADAAETVRVDYEVWPAVSDARVSQLEGAPLLFEGVPANVIFREVRQFGEVKFREGIDHITEIAFQSHRLSASPMEPRGCIVKYDYASGRIDVWSSTQAPHAYRTKLSDATGLSENRIRVITPDVGGAFGSKLPLHPEELAVSLAAIRLGQAVSWIEDRSDNLRAAPHARDQQVRLKLVMDGGGRFRGIRASFLGDAGAYSFNVSSALVEPYLAARALPGPYHFDAYEYEVTCVLTNKSPIAPYRGVGFSVGQAARELLIEQAAREVGTDPLELRRLNMVRSSEMPFTSLTGMTYDGGDYLRCLEAAVEAVGYDVLRKGQKQATQGARVVGIGVSPFVEPSGWGTGGSHEAGWSTGSFDGATVAMDPSGGIRIAVGTPSQGQDHATSLTQVAAQTLGIQADDISVIAGDTESCPISTAGTRSSRVAVVIGGAVTLAATELRKRILCIASTVMEADVADLQIENGHVSVVGMPSRTLPFKDLARSFYYSPALSPLRESVPDLSVTMTYDPPATYSSGCVAAVVSFDPEIGVFDMKHVVVVEDCGKVINQSAVNGQLHGAVVQAIGATLLERLVYDEHGQLLTGTLLDYALPTIDTVPPIDVYHQATSSGAIGGVKGMGESGMIGAPAAIACAMSDALASAGASAADVPAGLAWQATKPR